MQFEVVTLRNGVEQVLGPSSLAAAQKSVASLAREAVGREPFYAFVVAVPDDAQLPGKAEPELSR